jgi:hypothetical protein
VLSEKEITRERERDQWESKLIERSARTNLTPQGNWEREEEINKEKERERENGIEREKMDRMESRVIYICICQCWYSVSYQITNKRRFQRRKNRRKNLFFRKSAITLKKKEFQF